MQQPLPSPMSVLPKRAEGTALKFDGWDSLREQGLFSSPENSDAIFINAIRHILDLFYSRRITELDEVNVPWRLYIQIPEILSLPWKIITVEIPDSPNPQNIGAIIDLTHHMSVIVIKNFSRNPYFPFIFKIKKATSLYTFNVPSSAFQFDRDFGLEKVHLWVDLEKESRFTLCEFFTFLKKVRSSVQLSFHQWNALHQGLDLSEIIFKNLSPTIERLSLNGFEHFIIPPITGFPPRLTQLRLRYDSPREPFLSFRDVLRFYAETMECLVISEEAIKWSEFRSGEKFEIPKCPNLKEMKIVASTEECRNINPPFFMIYNLGEFKKCSTPNLVWSCRRFINTD